MVLLKIVVPLIFTIFLTSCSSSVQKIIEDHYIDKNATIYSLDRYSKILKKKDFDNQINNSYRMCQKLTLKNNILYIKLKVFNKRTMECFEDIGSYSGIIIDLRDNGGGLLDTAIALVDLFISKGKIITTQSQYGQKVYYAKEENSNINIPLVILINSQSASASEIVAGSLQSHKRAILVGTKSYGKGTIQQIIPLNKKSVLKLTVEKYLLPDQKSIDTKGIQPDISILKHPPFVKSSLLRYKYLENRMFDRNSDIALLVAVEVLR